MNTVYVIIVTFRHIEAFSEFTNVEGNYETSNIGVTVHNEILQIGKDLVVELIIQTVLLIFHRTSQFILHLEQMVTGVQVKQSKRCRRFSLLYLSGGDSSTIQLYLYTHGL